MRVNNEVKKIISLVWLDNQTTLRAFPEGSAKSYVIVQGEGEETPVNSELVPLHNIDNVDYKKKVLKKSLYQQMNQNADLVKENVDLSNKVYDLERYIKATENQTELAENSIEYWKEKYYTLKSLYCNE